MSSIEEKVIQLTEGGFNVGNPTSVIQYLPGGGRFQKFEYAFLYEQPTGQAYEVHGAILGLYIANGETAGPLGFPTTDEMDDPMVPGGKTSFFENGKITWNSTSGAVMEIHDQTDVIEIPEITITLDDLDKKLQEIADFAFNELLPLPQAEAKRRVLANWGSGNWCGFTVAYLYEKCGFNKTLSRKYFANTRALLAYGSYGHVDFNQQDGSYMYRDNPPRVPEQYVGGSYVSQENYHRSNGMERHVITYEQIKAGEFLDIVPGDIVLLDNANKGGPDHIQIVYDWYPEEQLLIVIDGNGGGFALESTGERATTLSPTTYSPDGIVTRDKLDWLNEKLGVPVIYQGKGSGRVGISCHVLTPEHQVEYDSRNPSKQHQRIWALIRPSIDDFNPDNQYRNL